MMTLTEHLLSLQTSPSYSSATQHTFLTQAGNGVLPLPRLALWLSQDRVYAGHAYPRFIGALIARIPFHQSDAVSGPREQHHQQVLTILVKCLDNIVREISFFGDVANKWDLNMEDWFERKGTRDYTAEMARISNSDSLVDGLVFLWAMERVYFDAWSYVHRLQSNNTPGNNDYNNAVGSFSKNWSSAEFEAFVNELGELVDGLGIASGTKAWESAEDVWKRVIELEIGFWPEDGEELVMKKKL